MIIIMLFLRYKIDHDTCVTENIVILSHNSDVIMGAMAFQIASLTIIY